MSLFLDLLIVVVMLVTVIGGYKRGFIKSVMHFASSLLAFFAAVFFTPSISAFLCENIFLPRISSGISETLTSLLSVGGNAISTERLFADMPEALDSIITRFNVDFELLADKFSSTAAATEETVLSMSDFIAEPIAQMISSVLAFLAVFVVAAVLLHLVTVFIGAVFELPVLKQLNSVLGLFFGIACAVLYAVIWSNLAIYLVEALNSIDPAIFTASLIDDTVIVKLFSNLKVSLVAEIFG